MDSITLSHTLWDYFYSPFFCYCSALELVKTKIHIFIYLFIYGLVVSTSRVLVAYSIIVSVKLILSLDASLLL